VDETLRLVSDHARNKYIKSRGAHVANCCPTKTYRGTVENAPYIINVNTA
jgi:hypothetical protein